jgi:hypothetical protein
MASSERFAFAVLVQFVKRIGAGGFKQPQTRLGFGRFYVFEMAASSGSSAVPISFA